MEEKLDIEVELSREPFQSREPKFSGTIRYTQTRQRPIPREYLNENRIISPYDHTPVTDAYKILRTQLIHRMVENGWKTLGITSPREGEGKTLTAINLAISFSTLSDRTVLLVDVDLKKPQLHRLFGIEERGVADFLLDEEPVEELLVNPGIDKLILLPAGRKIENSSDLLTSPKMLQMVMEVRNRYRERIVIFDLPPLLPSADVLAFSPHLDSILIVVESGKTDERDLKKSIEILHGIPIIGTVLNKA
jgi:protein-tyrosine kinase